MTSGVLISVASLGVTLLLAVVSGVVWLVRLEGRNTANAVAITALQAKSEAHESTKIEVVRLQEQIKHLTDLIEKWFEPIDPPAAKRRRTPQGTN